MIITVDCAAGRVSLEQPDVFTQFHVAATGGDAAAVVAALGADGKAADDEHVFVAVESIRAWARGRVGDDWEVGFGKMVDYARSKGWLDEAGTHIRAHLE
ncbi:MAG: hypothetical protein H6719_29415 [Sandaracinaceae bacterium]|nr:hypothetical protein [Sandaracinaceae bacterium]